MTTQPLKADDIKARIDLLQVVEHDLGQGKRSGAWVMFLCPFHDNHQSPALAVNVKTQTWKCFGCDKGGDVFTWTMLREGIGFREALQKHAGGVDLSGPPAHPVQPAAPVEDPPPAAWQARGREFLAYCKDQLFESTDGRAGLAELARRGITAQTAAAWNLGWCPKRMADAGARWGFEDGDPVNLFRGLVIPSFVGTDLWRIKFRIFEGDQPKTDKPKYLNARGSMKALFGADHVGGRETLLLCEGEPDALLAWQEARFFADVMTLGGAAMRMVGRWVPYLLPYPRIVVVYDPDKAGEKGAEMLKAFGERVEVHRPPGGDLCWMHQHGQDVQGWLAEILL